MPQVSFADFIVKARSGDCVISFPTDTVPALAVRPDQAMLLFEVKQRSLDKPLILMAATIAELWFYTKGTPAQQQIWQQVVDRYLPGALTLVLPASEQVPTAVNPQDPTTVGVRVPNHPIAQAILAETGPLATTSANLSGQLALQSLREIEAQFPQVFTLPPSELDRLSGNQITTAEGSTSGMPSTVARWTESGWEILRQGTVSIST